MEKSNKHSSVFEIIGVPGSGKTSLSRKIQNHDPLISLISSTNTSNLGLPHFNFASLSYLVFLLLHQASIKQNGWFARVDILALYELIWWKNYLTRELLDLNKCTVIDEGPIGILSWSMEFGSQYYKMYQAGHPFRGFLKHYAELFDGIILINVPFHLALEHIRTRDKNHWIGKMLDDKAIELLTQIHGAQMRAAISLASQANGPRLIKIETEYKSSDELDKQIHLQWSENCHKSRISRETKTW